MRNARVGIWQRSLEGEWRTLGREPARKQKATGGTPVQLENGRTRAGAYCARTLRGPSCPRHYERIRRRTLCYGATRSCTELGGPIYVSAKRTHRFVPEKQPLSICNT